MFESRMSSRHHNDHYYDSYDRSYANGSASGPSSRRRTYDYVKINPLLKKTQNKSKAKATGFSTAMGRRRPKGEWKQKRKEQEEQDIQALKSRKDAFSAEAIEAELNTFKKGTFVFDEKAETPTKKKEAKKAAIKINGDSKHSKFLLKRTSAKHPPPISLSPPSIFPVHVNVPTKSIII